MYDVDNLRLHPLFALDGRPSHGLKGDIGLIDVHDGSVKRIPAVRILMGLYDVNDKLIEKIDNDIEGDENLGYRSAWVNDEWPYTPGQRTKFKKMISGMWSGNGYVRIVIKRINMPDFDLKITPFNQQK